jgi:acetyltransferase-like isoleucine patch superfamily enzyme
VLGRGVYIGSYCICGAARAGIGHKSVRRFGSLAKFADVGRHVSEAIETTFEVVEIRDDCWIGASSIIMASVGFGTTVGAGAVVVRPISSQVVAVGKPTQAIKDVCPPSME